MLRSHIAFLLIILACSAGGVRAQNPTARHLRAPQNAPDVAPHLVGTAIAGDTLATKQAVSFVAPVDSIPREGHALKMYDLSHADVLAETYRSEGMPWFYSGHTVERYEPLLDEDRIPLIEYDFGPNRNPVMTSQAALAFYNAYRQSGADDHRQDFLKNIDWLLANHDDYYLRYAFEWKHGGRKLPAGWVSAMAQGEALAAVSTAYFVTGEEKYLEAAEGFFRTLHHNSGETWAFYVDDRGYYWPEEYPNVDRCRVLNGILFGLWGLWDYYVVSGDVLALDLFRAGIRSVADHLEEWNVEGENMSVYCRHRLRYDYYHPVHLEQLGAYAARFGVPDFEEAAELFQQYRLLVVLPSSIDFGEVRVGLTAEYDVLLDSRGTLPVAIESAETSAPAFAASFEGTKVDRRTIDTVRVSFSPLEIGDATGELTVRTQDGRHTVELFGRGIEGSSVAREDAPAPAAIALEAPYPNPFSSNLTFRFSVPAAEHVTITLFDALGREVARLFDGKVPPGSHDVNAPMRDLPNGTYFSRMEVGSFSATRRVVRLR